MRYYSIQISNSDGSSFRTYTSFANGKNIPGALNVYLDIPVVPFHQPMGASLIRIWGISLQEIGQASDLNNKLVKVFGGFQKGLPLANPAQAGLLVQGMIFQAFGNWVGKEQTLDLILQPATGTIEAPKNIVLNWKKGSTLASTLAPTLSTAFPGFKQDIQISSKLVLPNDEPGFYQTLTQFAQYINGVSKNIIKDDTYQGVSILLKEDTVTVYDGTTQTTPRQIQFQDLIGQPTWIESPLIQFKTAMRADLDIGDFVLMPKNAIATTTEASQSQYRSKSAFQGTFQLNQVRHVGDFRQGDAASWVTVFNAFPTSSS